MEFFRPNCMLHRRGKKTQRQRGRRSSPSQGQKNATLVTPEVDPLERKVVYAAQKLSDMGVSKVHLLSFPVFASQVFSKWSQPMLASLTTVGPRPGIDSSSSSGYPRRSVTFQFTGFTDSAVMSKVDVGCPSQETPKMIEQANAVSHRWQAHHKPLVLPFLLSA